MELFHSFFSKETEKELELLKLLYKQSVFLSIEKIGNYLNMDRRSVYKYYDLLDKEADSLSTNHQQILQFKRGQGYKFIGTKKDYKNLAVQVLQADPFFQLVKTLFLENEVTITKFSHKHFISESTIRKRLHELEELLASLDFSLKKKRGTIYLVGDEKRIRYFMVAFFWKNFSGLDWPFTTIAQEKCEEIVSNIYTECQLQVNKIEVEITCYVLAVTLLRFRKGIHIEQSVLTLHQSIPYLNQSILSQLNSPRHPVLKVLENNLRVHYLLEPSEIKFLFLWMQSNAKSFYIDTTMLSTSSAQPLMQESSSNLEMILNYINKTTDRPSISQEKKQLLYKTFLSGVLSVELFGNMDYTLTGYNLRQYLTLKFPDLLIQAEHFLKTASVYSENKQKREGLSLHLAIAWTIVMPPISFSKPIKIKLETDLPQAIEMGIMERIQLTLQSFYNIEISTTFEDNQYDVCLSTTPAAVLEDTANILLINAQVSSSDLANIQKRIEMLNH